MTYALFEPRPTRDRGSARAARGARHRRPAQIGPSTLLDPSYFAADGEGPAYVEGDQTSGRTKDRFGGEGYFALAMD
jgi:hypothetical protein